MQPFLSAPLSSHRLHLQFIPTSLLERLITCQKISSSFILVRMWTSSSSHQQEKKMQRLLTLLILIVLGASIIVKIGGKLWIKQRLRGIKLSSEYSKHLPLSRSVAMKHSRLLPFLTLLPLLKFSTSYSPLPLPIPFHSVSSYHFRTIPHFSFLMT